MTKRRERLAFFQEQLPHRTRYLVCQHPKKPREESGNVGPNVVRYSVYWNRGFEPRAPDIHTCTTNARNRTILTWGKASNPSGPHTPGSSFSTVASGSSLSPPPPPPSFVAFTSLSSLYTPCSSRPRRVPALCVLVCFSLLSPVSSWYGLVPRPAPLDISLAVFSTSLFSVKFLDVAPLLALNKVHVDKLQRGTNTPETHVGLLVLFR